MRPALRAGASLCLLLACLAPASRRDGGTDLSRDILRLYLDCDHALRSDDEPGAPGPRARIASDVALRRSFEAEWRARFAAWGDGALTATARGAWRYPLEDAVSLVDNYSKPTGSHEALDIFVARPGVEVRAPTAGVVIAAGDGWRGGWDGRLGALRYSGGGLSRNSGNGIVLFEPGEGAYFLFAHLRQGLRVRAGDVVPAGAPLGRVGNSGTAARPGHGRHLHLAYKEPGTGCGVREVLVAKNPYARLHSALERERRSLRRALAALRPTR